MQAREELARVRPGRDASLAAWLAYYQRAAALYAELAESDRAALYAELAEITIMSACIRRSVTGKAPKRSRLGSKAEGRK